MMRNPTFSFSISSRIAARVEALANDETPAHKEGAEEGAEAQQKMEWSWGHRCDRTENGPRHTELVFKDEAAETGDLTEHSIMGNADTPGQSRKKRPVAVDDGFRNAGRPGRIEERRLFIGRDGTERRFPGFSIRGKAQIGCPEYCDGNGGSPGGAFQGGPHLGIQPVEIGQDVRTTRILQDMEEVPGFKVKVKGDDNGSKGGRGQESANEFEAVGQEQGDPPARDEAFISKVRGQGFDLFQELPVRQSSVEVCHGRTVRVF